MQLQAFKVVIIILDIGIDIVSISRFHGKDAGFAKSFLTPSELLVFSSFSQKKSKEAYLASRWASKEAIFKATQDKDFLKYSILNDSSGKPYIEGHPEMKISISHDGDAAIAIVILDK